MLHQETRSLPGTGVCCDWWCCPDSGRLLRLIFPSQRTKKRRWKGAYAAASAEVESLHKQLLAKQKELEGLEGRLKRLEAELRMLGAGAGSSGGVRLPAAAVAATGEPCLRDSSNISVVCHVRLW